MTQKSTKTKRKLERYYTQSLITLKQVNIYLCSKNFCVRMQTRNW